MGRISDAAGIQRAFVVPLLCYLYVLYFGMSGYKPTLATSLHGIPAESEGLSA
jgi:fucose permease